VDFNLRLTSVGNGLNHLKCLSSYIVVGIFVILVVIVITATININNYLSI